MYMPFRTEADDKAFFRAIDVNQSVIRFDPNGNIVFANDNFLAVMGYSRAEVIGHHHSMFVERSYAASPNTADSGKTCAPGRRAPASSSVFARTVPRSHSSRPTHPSSTRTGRYRAFSRLLPKSPRARRPSAGGGPSRYPNRMPVPVMVCNPDVHRRVCQQDLDRNPSRPRAVPPDQGGRHRWLVYRRVSQAPPASTQDAARAPSQRTPDDHQGWRPVPRAAHLEALEQAPARLGMW